MSTRERIAAFTRSRSENYFFSAFFCGEIGEAVRLADVALDGSDADSIDLKALIAETEVATMECATRLSPVYKSVKYARSVGNEYTVTGNRIRITLIDMSMILTQCYLSSRNKRMHITDLYYLKMNDIK